MARVMSLTRALHRLCYTKRISRDGPGHDERDEEDVTQRIEILYSPDRLGDSDQRWKKRHRANPECGDGKEN